MGIQPEPIVAGSSCSLCYPVGVTPKYLKIFFSGIQRGNSWHSGLIFPPNGYTDLVQDPAKPCAWISDGSGGYTVRISHISSSSFLTCISSVGRTIFTKRIFDQCVMAFENALSLPSSGPYYGGSAHISTATALKAVSDLVGPADDPNPRWENFPVSDSQTVVRYAGKRDASNLHILFDLPYP